MLWRRTVSALVGVPVILGLIYLGGVAYALAAGAVLAAGALELHAALGPGHRRGPDGSWHLVAQPPRAYLGLALLALLVAAAYHGPDWWAGALALSLVITFLWGFAHRQPAAALEGWLAQVAALAYLGLLGSHLVLLRRVENGQDWVTLAVFGAFAADTSAYLVGRLLGRHRIAPHLSPGKTAEGTLGGLLLGALGVVLINWATGLRLAPLQIAPLALLVPLAATLGDLAESFLKRGAGVKDASRLIPGHGGFLDRLDSVLFVVPLVYYWRLWVIG
ncbi:Phosphatidate cytidylyltransferase [bacterium HR25]|jgi:phosphatidate cytidylyltransferase|nr:Phosphatidate cytidylyltransferase [bacterium HR25]